MKKFISMLAGVVMASSLFAVSAYAAGNVTFSADKTEVKEGEKITITVNSKAKTVSTDGFNVKFDTSVFECIEAYDDYNTPLSGGKAAFGLYNGGRYPTELKSSTIAEANSEGKFGFYVVGSGNADYHETAPVAKIEFVAKKAIESVAFILNEDSDGTSGYKGVCDTINVKVVGEEPAADVTIKGAYKTTNAEWIAKKGNTLWWGVDYAEGKFPGEVEVTIFSADKEKKFNLGLDASIQGAVSFGVFAVVGDSTDALNIKVGDVTGAGYVAFENAPVAE